MGSGGGPFLPSSSYIPGGCSPHSLHKHRGQQAHRKKPDSPSACCGQPRAEGDKQVLREWREDLRVCTTHGRKTVKQESVARANQARLVSSSKQSVQPAGHSDSKHLCEAVSQFAEGSTYQESKKSKQRKGLGPEYTSHTNQVRHHIAWLASDQLPKRGQTALTH